MIKKMEKKAEQMPSTKIGSSVVVDCPNYVPSVLECRILIYLNSVPDIQKSTKKIYEKFLKTHQNYSYLTVILRKLEALKLIKSQQIKGGKAKAWFIFPEKEAQIMEFAVKNLEKYQKNE